MAFRHTFQYTHFFKATCLLLILTAVTPRAKAADDEPDMRRVVRELVQRAKNHMRDLNAPAQVSPIVTEKYKGKGSGQILDLLAQKHSSDREIDIYVKAQLLAFKPKINEATDDQLQKIIRAMPSLDALPPGNSLDEIVAKSKKEKIPSEVTKGPINKVNVSIKNTQSGNLSALYYRKELIYQLPSENGLKLYAMLVNNYDLAVSGAQLPIKTKKVDNKRVPAEPTLDMANAAEEAATVGSLTSSMQRKILSELEKIRALHGKIQLLIQASVNDKGEVWVQKTNSSTLLGEGNQFYTQIKEKVTTATASAR